MLNLTLKFKVLARSSDACCINYLFVELKYHGNDILVGRALYTWSAQYFLCSTKTPRPDTTYDLEVFNATNNIKSNAIGMDGIPVRFIKLLIPFILPYITHILNTIHKFLQAWKTSKIMPIAKNNDPATLSDYRPVGTI
jgi:hypothetical protein